MTSMPEGRHPASVRGRTGIRHPSSSTVETDKMHILPAAFQTHISVEGAYLKIEQFNDDQDRTGYEIVRLTKDQLSSLAALIPSLLNEIESGSVEVDES